MIEDHGSRADPLRAFGICEHNQLQRHCSDNENKLMRSHLWIYGLKGGAEGEENILELATKIVKVENYCRVNIWSLTLNHNISRLWWIISRLSTDVDLVELHAALGQHQLVNWTHKNVKANVALNYHYILSVVSPCLLMAVRIKTHELRYFNWSSVFDMHSYSCAASLNLNKHCLVQSTNFIPQLHLLQTNIWC